MNTKLLETLRRFTNTLNTTALHPRDEDLVKLTFRVLNKHGVDLTPDEVEDYLIENKWSNKSITRVKGWAQAIESGRQVKLKYKAMLPSESEVWELLNV